MNRQDRNSEYLPPSVTPLSTRHRSKIQALHYHTHSQTLYSGGADHIMSWYPLDSSSAVDGGYVKLNDRINHILANTVNPHLLLLWDMRYKDVAEGGPSHSWNGHHNRVLRTLFIPGNTMVNVGTDKYTVFTDYSLHINGNVSART
ncbi:unnamed protein product [Umbelopsis vinacea]